MLLALGACVHEPAPAYQAGIANLQALRISSTTMAVDTFTAEEGVNDSRLIMRGNSMTGGGPDSTFSAYLQQALEIELRNAGRFDTASRLRLSGALSENRLSTADFSVGSATVRARFVLTRDGQVIYDKVHTAEHEWDSSFLAALAIPAGMQGYVATVQKLIGDLFTDPDFIAATR